jgi:hypothetical protein
MIVTAGKNIMKTEIKQYANPLIAAYAEILTFIYTLGSIILCLTYLPVALRALHEKIGFPIFFTMVENNRIMLDSFMFFFVEIIFGLFIMGLVWYLADNIFFKNKDPEQYQLQNRLILLVGFAGGIVLFLALVSTEKQMFGIAQPSFEILARISLDIATNAFIGLLCILANILLVGATILVLAFIPCLIFLLIGRIFFAKMGNPWIRLWILGSLIGSSIFLLGYPVMALSGVTLPQGTFPLVMLALLTPFGAFPGWLIFRVVIAFFDLLASAWHSAWFKSLAVSSGIVSYKDLAGKIASGKFMGRLVLTKKKNGLGLTWTTFHTQYLINQTNQLILATGNILGHIDEEGRLWETWGIDPAKGQKPRQLGRIEGTKLLAVDGKMIGEWWEF